MYWLHVTFFVFILFIVTAAFLALLKGGHRYDEKDDSAITRHTYDKRLEDKE